MPETARMVSTPLKHLMLKTLNFFKVLFSTLDTLKLDMTGVQKTVLLYQATLLKAAAMNESTHESYTPALFATCPHSLLTVWVSQSTSHRSLGILCNVLQACTFTLFALNSATVTRFFNDCTDWKM